MVCTITLYAAGSALGSDLAHSGIKSSARCVITSPSMSMLRITLVALNNVNRSGVTETVPIFKSTALPTSIQAMVTCGSGNPTSCIFLKETGSFSLSETIFSS